MTSKVSKVRTVNVLNHLIFSAFGHQDRLHVRITKIRFASSKGSVS